MKIVTILFAALVFQSCTNKHKYPHSHHRFDNAQKWAKIFEDKQRDKWQRPDLVLNRLNITKNSLIADIGSATGYFPIRMARIASEGRVWGVDIEPNLVRYLNQRARKEGIKNLFSILGTYSDPLIPEKVDFIFIVNTFHHILHRNNYLKKLRKNLNENGKIVIIDFKKGKLPFGPKNKMKISKKNIIKELNDSNFLLENDFNILKYQNFLVFK